MTNRPGGAAPNGVTGHPAGENLPALRHDKSLASDRPAVPVFFLSDSTGISAETMGNAVLIQFPHVGICGQGPSDHPDLADRLLDQGIESMSLNPDSVIDSWTRLAGTAAAQAVREAGTP